MSVKTWLGQKELTLEKGATLISRENIYLFKASKLMLTYKDFLSYPVDVFKFKLQFCSTDTIL
ncbi:MAG: hypothetical protein AB8U25_00150 [Rickettsiales endosymbiont of Dermacentor nuttalli]